MGSWKSGANKVGQKVFKFKICLEELFRTLEDKPSELSKTSGSFVARSLAPLYMQLRQQRSKSGAWERLRSAWSGPS